MGDAKQSNAHGALGWIDIVRLGLVQASLGAIAVLSTSTLNRVMVVELALAAMVPGILVTLHYAVQITRPLWGHGSDSGGRRTSWILGGLALAGLGSVGAAAASAVMATNFALGMALAVVDFILIGIGIGAAGTSLLALLATNTAAPRRAGAATLVWLMMIAGMAITSIAAGAFLDPFTPGRLVVVTAIVSAAALALAGLSLAGIEGRLRRNSQLAPEQLVAKVSFRESLADAWADRQARRFTIFVFLSMLAFSAQDLILEPYAGLVFAMTPGETTTLSGIQSGGVFIGMLLVGLLGSSLGRTRPGVLKIFTVAGCIASATALALLGASSQSAGGWPLTANVFALGFANGVFAVAAIGSMMALAGAANRPGERPREGMRMGLWGAAQAIAFGLGGFAGTIVVDIARAVLPVEEAYALVFMIEAGLFLIAAAVALAIAMPSSARLRATTSPSPDVLQPAE
jgi:MFS transporter, BCD family, chlorophyll transporter